MLSEAPQITTIFTRRIGTIADYIEGKCTVIAQEGKTKEKWEVDKVEECLQIQEEGGETAGTAVGLTTKTVAQRGHVTTIIHDKEEIVSKIEATRPIQKLSVANVHER